MGNNATTQNSTLAAITAAMYRACVHRPAWDRIVMTRATWEAVQALIPQPDLYWNLMRGVDVFVEETPEAAKALAISLSQRDPPLRVMLCVDEGQEKTGPAK